MPISSWIRGHVPLVVAIFLVLCATAYANVPRASVGTPQLKRGAVATPKLAAQAVRTGKLAKRAVKAPKIARGAVKTGKLAADAATGAKVDEASLDRSILQRRIADACPAGQAIRSVAQSGAVSCQAGGGVPSGPAGGDLAGAYPNPQIADGAVGTAKLADAAVTMPKLAAGSVDSSKVVDDSLTGADIDESTLAGIWFLNGNAGTDPTDDFLGTTDDVPLELRVNDARALRLEPASDGTNESPNVIGGIADNAVTDGVHSATIGGGGRGFALDDTTANRVTDDFGTVGGGADNQAGDGAGTTSNRQFTTVGGGLTNTASGTQSTVGGGDTNTASGVEATVGGGNSNTASELWSTVGGGLTNTASANQATIGGGQSNTASEIRATVGGGAFNTASAEATVGGGARNTAIEGGATVGGGTDNSASGSRATVGGGSQNVASEFGATIGGGQLNTAGGLRATVPGGSSNEAAGIRSFAAGRRAKANHDGAFVWGDNTNADFSSIAANEFAARASGGVRFVVGAQTCTLNPADGSWACASDRNLKREIEPVDGRSVLARLAAMPINTWSWRDDESGTRHLGPFAQDFYRAFGLGSDRKRISTIDADGIALAAIKGLNERLEAKVGRLEADNDELGSRIATLEAEIVALRRRVGRR